MSCNDWKEVEVGDFIVLNYGKSLPKTKRIEGKYNVYGSSGVTGTHKDYLVEGPGIIVGRKGTVGKVNYERENYFPIDTTYYVTESDKYNLKFMYYFLQTLSLDKMNSHSAIPGLNREAVYKLKVKLPELENQDKIANILSSLDDKIELNNEMNKSLEEMAQALFKRWFVDFEFPDEDGQPYKSSGGEMVESELGMIPKGWEVKALGDIGNVVTGKTPSAKVEGSYGDECNFITPRDINTSTFIMNTERQLSNIGVEKLKKNIVCKNSIGVSCIGSNLGEVYITGEDSITNQQINTVVLKDSSIYPYVYIYLKNMKEDFLNMAGGSAVPIINKTAFSGINILIPDTEMLHKYTQLTTCYFDRIKNNIIETNNLMETRDSLLPKLMIGEIEVTN